MRNILDTGNCNVLREYVGSDTLIGLDFDGTLAPIVRERRRAVLRPATRSLLAELASRFQCVVISGRAKDDVIPRLRGTGVSEIIGNHGIEPWSASPELEKAVRQWLPLLNEGLGPYRGVEIEDKRYSVSVHYRGETRKQEAIRKIESVARSLGPVRVIGGNQVVNILPLSAPNKGLAFVRHLARSGCSKAIYIGDDDTDEDVFSLCGRGQTLTIRVGLNHDSLAEYYLRRQQDIDRLILRLLDFHDGRRVVSHSTGR
ncbi:MAG: trehalose-phosphatase [Gammaproteobacteria bacterium RIFCSPLOWO2_02_FULL_61_13]|nr:MAG: trehalose-phosphatase [Gammaproteobacteria bacterium RIFCSPLOWO2_02_FULL_61_13]